MAYEAIIYEKKNKVAYITLNRPEALNAWNNAMNEETNDAFLDADNDNDIYVIVLTGKGRAFQSGADVKEMAKEARSRTVRGIGAAGRAQKPVVCAINGICCGAGLILLGGCDVIICSDNATFFDPHVSIGLLPLSETFGSATSMPYHLSIRMALMGLQERMSAERAYQVGLVSEVVPQDKLMERATEIAQAIAEQGPLAVRAIKETMNRMFHVVPYAESQKEAHHLHETINRAPDGIEGPRAFAQKRKPQWTGKPAQ